MAAHVDGDIDAVAADEVGNLIVAQAHGRAPMVGKLPEAVGCSIGPCHLGVAEDLDLGPVVMGKDGLDEVAGGVLAEVGGEVGDAQAATRARIIVEGGSGGKMLPGVGCIEATVLGEDVLGALGGVVVEAEEQVGVGQLVIRLQPQRLPE